MTGRIRSTAFFSAEEVHFGRHSVLSSLVSPATIIVKPLASVVRVEATPSGDGWAALVRRGDADPPTYELSVFPKGPFRIGEFKSDIGIVLIGESGAMLSERRIPIKITFVSDILPSLPEVHFGPRRIGDTVRESISLSSLTGTPFCVTSLEAVGKGLEVEEEISNDGEMVLTIRQHIRDVGAQGGKLIVTTCAGETESNKLEINVKYIGQDRSDQP